MTEQGTQEWLNERIGFFTASRLIEILPGARGGYNASRAGYIAEKAIERLTSESAEKGFTSSYMDRGTELEPLARVAYEEHSGEWVELAGFCPHPSTPYLGGSPDGLVRDDGCIEIKCPKHSTHLATLQGTAIDRKYIIQMQTVMLVKARAWCDFVSYDPDMPENARLFVKRFKADRALHSEILFEVEKANKEVEAAMAFIQAYTLEGK